MLFILFSLLLLVRSEFRFRLGSYFLYISVLFFHVLLTCLHWRQTQLHNYQTTWRHAPDNPFCGYPQSGYHLQIRHDLLF
jgi:hypothetical protein